MRASPLCVLVLAGAASARSILGLGRRQDGDTIVEPKVWLYAPTEASASCSVGEISWIFTDSVEDVFDIYVTNIGIVYTETPGTTTSTPTLGSASGTRNPPTQPTEPTFPLFRRRLDIDYPIYAGLRPDPNDNFRNWQIALPNGWYKLRAVSQSLDSTTHFFESNQFRVYDADMSCIDPDIIGGPSSSSSNPPPQDTGITAPPPPPPEPSSSSSSAEPGVIAGAVVGSLFGVAAVGGLFLLLLRRRNASRSTPRSAASAWGPVNSKDSRNGGSRGLGLPPGTPNRLSRNADALVAGVPDMDQDSIEEKERSGAPSPTFSPEPPIFRRHSQTSQAFVLGPVSTRDSRRSTVQSIPTTVTPTNATPAPSPYPGSEAYSPDTAVAPSLARSNSTAKKLARKPVPAYSPHNSATTPPKGASEDGHDEADLGAQMISQSQRSDSVLMSGFPFELEGAREVHYLIPDPPAPPRQ